jgi:hypothetical protein
MGGKRNNVPWVHLEGGPLAGTRFIAGPGELAEVMLRYAPSPVPGMRAVHQYQMTTQRRSDDREGGTKLGVARVARYVRTLPDEPIPPPVKRDFYGSPVN